MATDMNVKTHCKRSYQTTNKHTAILIDYIEMKFQGQRNMRNSCDDYVE